MKSVKDEGLITQLAVVATMMPKVKEYIDQQADRIADLETTLAFKKIKPLSDEEILNEWLGNDRNFYYFARAIEERHGIK